VAADLPALGSPPDLRLKRSTATGLSSRRLQRLERGRPRLCSGSRCPERTAVSFLLRCRTCFWTRRSTWAARTPGPRRSRCSCH